MEDVKVEKQLEIPGVTDLDQRLTQTQLATFLRSCGFNKRNSNNYARALVRKDCLTVRILASLEPEDWCDIGPLIQRVHVKALERIFGDVFIALDFQHRGY